MSYSILRNQTIHFQIISVISSINGAILRIISVVSRNHTDNWKIDKDITDFGI